MGEQWAAALAAFVKGTGRTGRNEVSGGRIGTVVQAQVIHGGVWIGAQGAAPRMQAVSAWTGPHVDRCPEAGRAGAGAHGLHFHHVVVHNGTAQPIHDVSVSVPVPDAELLPCERPLMFLAVGLVEPGERRQLDIGHQGQFAPQFQVPLEIHFTDVDGDTWCRTEHGSLERDPADHPDP